MFKPLSADEKKQVKGRSEHSMRDQIAPPDQGGGEKDHKPNQRERVLLIGMQTQLWSDSDQVAYTSVTISNHHENYPVRSRRFRAWVLREYGKRFPVKITGGGTHPGAPSSQAVAEGLNGLEAIALGGPQFEPCVRVGVKEGHVYIDLGQPDWAAIEIDDQGWRIVADPPVKFVRPAGLRPLPTPRTGGELSRLRRFVNVRSDDDYVLVVGWLIGTLCPRGPYPILVVNGEQGSAKTTLCRMLRRLIDPNEGEVRSAPREERDFFIAAKNGYIIVLDNLSSLKANLADAMCRLSTGAGFATRTLYTNLEETIISQCRPLIVNGIPDLATRSDLLDRAIVLTLPRLPEGQRKPETQLWREFASEGPMILGALLDATVCALSRRGKVQLSHVPRMADFAMWVEGAGLALGWKHEQFLGAYEQNRANAVAAVIEADTLAHAVLDFVLCRGKWDGTASELLDELNQQVDEKVQRRSLWPRTPAQLSNGLRRAAPTLRHLGVCIEFVRERNRRVINLEKVCKTPSPPSPASPSTPNTLKIKDVDGDAAVTVGDDTPRMAVTRNSLKTRVGDGGDGCDAEFAQKSEWSVEL